MAFTITGHRAHAIALAAIVTVTVGVVALHRGPVSPLAGADRWFYDRALLPALPGLAPSGRVAVVEVDDAALYALGERWPLSRGIWAEIVERVAAHDPAVIALTMVFDQPTEASAQALGAAVMERVRGDPRLRGLASWLEGAIADRAQDRQLSRALAGSERVVLAAIFTGGGGIGLSQEIPARMPPLGPIDRRVALRAEGVVTAHPQLAVSAYASGGINVLVDPDGVVRRYPYLARIADGAYPSLALAAVLGASPERRDSEALVAELAGWDGAAPHLAWPEDDAGVPSVSVADLWRDGAPPDGGPLAGRIVFVGPTAAGTAGRLRGVGRAPVSGVEVHAIAAENLLAGSVRVAEGAPEWWSALFALLALGGFAWLSWRGVRPRALVAFGGGALAVHACLVVAAAHGGWLLALTPTPVGLGALAVAEVVVRWRLTARERRRLTARERRRLTARERTLEAERRTLERFRSFVDHVVDAMLTVDDRGRVVWMNRAAEGLFLRHRDTATGAHVGDLVPAWREGIPAAAPEGAGARRPAEPHETEARLPGGEAVPIEVTVTAMRLGGGRFDNVVIRDIGTRKALEQRRADFVAAMNHELRAPVTSIIGSLRLVAPDDGRDPDSAQLIAVAMRNAERLRSLVDDLLDLARIEAGAATYAQEPHPASALVRDAVESMAGFASEHGVHVSLDTSLGAVEVRCCARRVEQVLSNLLSNAIKHTPTEGTVRVRADVAHERVRVAVSDEGPGIAPEARERIFERFAVAEGPHRRGVPATGLGLTIARAIVEEHGGDIGLESEVGAGSTFWFTLPRLV